MECTYCDAELDHTDSYGTRAYICYGEKSGKSGDIFKCPNHEGFDTEEEARDYDPDFKGDWEEITCGSSTHCVSGSFYTDKSDNLHEGYPC